MDWDRYAYSLNNPVRYVDPSGHRSCTAEQAATGDETCDQNITAETPSGPVLPDLPDIPDDYGLTDAERAIAEWAYALFWTDPATYTYNREIFELAMMYWALMDGPAPWFTPEGEDWWIVPAAKDFFAGLMLIGGGAMMSKAADALTSGTSQYTPGYYLAGKAPYQVTPGTTTVSGYYVNDLGRVEPWTAYYDQYGRLIARTDFNAGNLAAGIPDIHYHLYEWGPGKTPLEVGSHIPGPYMPP